MLSQQDICRFLGGRGWIRKNKKEGRKKEKDKRKKEEGRRKKKKWEKWMSFSFSLQCLYAKYERNEDTRLLSQFLFESWKPVPQSTDFPDYTSICQDYHVPPKEWQCTRKGKRWCQPWPKCLHETKKPTLQLPFGIPTMCHPPATRLSISLWQHYDPCKFPKKKKKKQLWGKFFYIFFFF